MSFCDECPIGTVKPKLEGCKKRCETELEQANKVIAAEQLWDKVNELYQRMADEAQIIQEIEEEYEL